MTAVVITVEVAFNAGYSTAAASRTWTDVTTYLEGTEGLSIARGRSDEMSEVSPSTLTLTLDNKDGRFTAGLATSPYYPNVKIGRPIRVTATPSGGAASVRFVGYVDEWPVAWPGGSSGYATATLTASSRTARLGLDSPLKSSIEEELLDSTPAILYPLSEPTDATSASDLMGGPRARMVGTGADVEFGTDSGLAGRAAATFAGGKGLLADADITDAGVDMWMACVFNTSASVDQVMAAAYGAYAAGVYGLAVEVSMDTAGTVFAAGSIPTLSSPSTYKDGQTHLAVIRLVQNGANIDGTMWIDGVSVDTGSAAGTLVLDVEHFVIGISTDTFGSYASPWVGTLSYASLGFTNPTSVVADWAAAVLDGFNGDTPAERLARYAGYANIATAEQSFATGSAPMAHIDTTGQTSISLMQQVSATDGGALFDARDGTLTYQGRDVRYLAAAVLSLSMADHEVEADYSPKLDRSALLNDVTAISANERISARAFDASSRDEYGLHQESLELATNDEDEILGAAWWRVNTYAEPTPRVPTLSVEILPLSTVRQALMLTLDIGSRVTVTNLPVQAAASSADYFVEGYTETITPESYRFTLNVTDGSAWLTTWVLDSGTRSQLDSTTTLAY